MELRRDLSLTSLTMIVVTGTIGSGWLVASDEATHITRHTSWYRFTTEGNTEQLEPKRVFGKAFI